MNRIWNRFRLRKEKEDFAKISEDINNDVSFRGTNLWILVFAILIASLGLNVNSTAVIIGAMLISPLMGPIIGLGFGLAINDLALLRKALASYLFAIGVGLATSTVYFLLSPLSDVHSEILARISPNIYDVMIALFGGFAGILAFSSKRKGNVIPGVAIATALMPPLCTAGFGLATWNFSYFFGASYLFLINTVFIALAALITIRFLRFPMKSLPEERDEIKAKRIVWGIVLVTLLPSIYFGYDIVQQNKFQKAANYFINREGVFPNDYLLKKTVDAKNGTIELTYGGQPIEEAAVESLRNKLPDYDLQGAKLQVNQGFAFLEEVTNDNDDQQLAQLTVALANKESQVQLLEDKLDDLDWQSKLGAQIYAELKVQYPSIQSFILQPARNNTDMKQDSVWVAIISSDEKLVRAAMDKIEQFLKVRINTESLKIYFEVIQEE